MVDALLDALVDTGKLLPILFLTYLLMEYLEHHAGGGISRCLQRSRGQDLRWVRRWDWCLSAASPALPPAYMRRGPLPWERSCPCSWLPPMRCCPFYCRHRCPFLRWGAILGLKFLAGAAVGFAVDAVLRLQHHQREPDIHGFCQQEHCSCEGGIFRSALRHTVKIVILIFAVTLLLNLAFLWLPHQKLQVVWNIPVLGEVVAAFLGLFPNCAASVLLTNLYVQGIMGLGPMLSGLMVNAGVGLLVLFRVSRNRKENGRWWGFYFCPVSLLGSVFGLLFGEIL